VAAASDALTNFEHGRRAKVCASNSLEKSHEFFLVEQLIEAKLSRSLILSILNSERPIPGQNASREHGWGMVIVRHTVYFKVMGKVS
jgi:hypothetical protein